MSITPTDIQKLAELSRMKLTPEDQIQFAKEIDSILGYIEQIKEVSTATGSIGTHADKTPDQILHRNALREDVVDTILNTDPSILVHAAPASEDGYIKVKKILN